MQDQDSFNWLPRLRVLNTCGYTLAEVLVAAFIMTIIFAALFMTLTVGELSNTVSLAKLEAQAEIRKDLGWIIKDLRQTDRMRLTGIDPIDGVRKELVNLPELTPLQSGAFTDPQFDICVGYDGAIILWSTNPLTYPIRYTFYQVNQQLIRSDTRTGVNWTFNNISQVTFTKIDNFNLRVSITGQTTARGTIKPTFTLEEEVKLRNG